MTVINTNTASINAQYNLNKVNQEMEKAMEQLSSGKRINSRLDDAAGLALPLAWNLMLVAYQWQSKMLGMHSR